MSFDTTWPVRVVICNTSPLQYQANRLDLLRTLFGRVQVPPAVEAELAEGRRRSVPLPDLAEIPWIAVRSVRDLALLPPVAHLGNGEKEVLALGLETPNHLLVLDDRNARRRAAADGLDITGTLGILMLAKERGVIEMVRPLLDRLHELRFRVSAKTRETVLDMAGERR